jgi:TolB protein
LQKDASVLLLSRNEDGTWFSIEYPPGTGQVGWIFGEIVIPGGDTAALPVGFAAPKPPEGAIFATVRSEGDSLRMRGGPGTSYEILARIPDRTRITLIGKLADDSWYQALYPPGSGTIGWVSGEFLALEGSTAAMQVAQAPPTPTPGPTAVPRPTRAPNAPTGGSILVSSNQSGAFDLVSIGENGALRRQLTQNGNAFGARYSPDGERIVFFRTVSAALNTVSHIFVMDFDGTALADLSTRAGGNFSDSDPDWSPDGSRIVFVRTPRAGAPELWIMNANGGNARQLLRLSAATGIAGGYSPSPRWSPDGGRIVFAAVPRATTPGAPSFPSVFVVDVNGTQERRLTDNDLINALPLWSPDGGQIAWSAKDVFSRQNWRGLIMNASGADQRLFLAPPGGDTNNGIQPVAWRNNRVLAAGWTGNWNVFVADAGGSNLTQVTRGAFDEIPTDWLP